MPGLIAALPDLALGAMFVVTWAVPDALGRRMVAYLMGVMLLEFVIIHSSGFMGVVWLGDKTRTERVLTLLGIATFYSVFAGGLALVFESWWPFIGFWGLTANKLLGVLVGRSPREMELDLLQHGWGGALALYVLAVTVTILAPLPALGVTRDVLSSQRLPGAGLPWTDEPQRVIAAGYLYFTALALSEMTDFAWVFRWLANARDRIARAGGLRSP